MEQYTNFVKEIQKIPARVGSITPPQQHFILKFLREHPEVKEILETGFHMGLSAATMMMARPDIYVTSFDIFWFDYTRRAKLLLDIFYPTRNILIAGNSICSLQAFFARFPSYSPDFVFLDGGHTRPIPFLDLYFILKNIKPGTWIMMDDYCQEHGSNGVIEAVDECIQKGYIENVTAHKAHDRGWILGKRSNKEIQYSEKTSPAELDKVYRDVESDYP